MCSSACCSEQLLPSHSDLMVLCFLFLFSLKDPCHFDVWAHPSVMAHRIHSGSKCFWSHLLLFPLTLPSALLRHIDQYNMTRLKSSYQKVTIYFLSGFLFCCRTDNQACNLAWLYSRAYWSLLEWPFKKPKWHSSSFFNDLGVYSYLFNAAGIDLADFLVLNVSRIRQKTCIFLKLIQPKEDDR